MATSVAIATLFLLIGAACNHSGSSSSNLTTSGGNTYGCPERLIVQTEWFPEPEHAYVYQLIGTNGNLDAAAGAYWGKIEGTGITLEVRAGGPFSNNQNPAQQMYSNPDIFMGFVDTSTSIEDYKRTPAVAVFANFEKGPQILMWNPERYDFKSFEEIGDSGLTIAHFPGANYIKYLVGKGIIEADQADGSYDGSPARFISSNGGIVQQGFATSEPYQYEFEIEGWKKPVQHLLIHDSGHAIYQSALSVRPESITEHAECLRFIVPKFQQGLVDYMNNPGPINVRLDEIVKAIDSFWTSSVERHNWTTQQMKNLGLITDGNNGYLGDMDEARIQKLIDELTPIYRQNRVDGFGAGDDRLQANTIFTNQFLDQSISIGY